MGKQMLFKNTQVDPSEFNSAWYNDRQRGKERQWGFGRLVQIR